MRWRSWFTARRKVHFSMCTHIGRCIGIDQSWLRPRLGVRCPKRLRHRSIKLRHRGKPNQQALRVVGEVLLHFAVCDCVIVSLSGTASWAVPHACHSTGRADSTAVPPLPTPAEYSPISRSSTDRHRLTAALSIRIERTLQPTLSYPAIVECTNIDSASTIERCVCVCRS